MKAVEAITRARAVYSELESDSRVCQWLSEIEERICIELSQKKFVKITESTSQVVLCAPDAYAEVYPLYLIMKMSLSNSDYNSYVCHSEAFNSAYTELAKYYLRRRELPDGNYYKFF